MARAAIVLADEFPYPNGPVATAAGTLWTAHSGSAAGEEVLVVSGRLQLTFSNTEDVNASLTNQPYPAAGGAVLYARFTVYFTALPISSGSYFAHLMAGTSHRCVVWAATNGAPGGQFRLGIGNTAAATVTSGQLTHNLLLNSPYTIVIRYNVGTGASTLWLNPAAESDPSVTASDAPNPASITAWAFRQTTGIGTSLVDDLRLGTSFDDVMGPTNLPPGITTQPQDQIVSEGDDVTFTIEATGSAPLRYQWQFNGTNLAGAMGSALALVSVTTNQAGDYSVLITNLVGSSNSQTATLTVNPAPAVVGFSLLNYNTKGFGTADWSTNAPQVQAIGRQLKYLQPDIVTLQEIPYTNTYQMANWVIAYLPGYYLATNSGTDGSLRSAILSRYPMTSFKWLDGADLKPFGYTNASGANADNFTRDLFEARIMIPGFPQPLHVFTTHLKATAGQTNYADAAAKRAAEAAAITNFLVTNLFALHPSQPYVLTGDLNDSDTNTPAIQRLLNPVTGLRLTNPANPVTGSINTFSTSTANPGERIDFILPCELLASNVRSGQVFRTDRLSPLPSNLFSNDCKVASDHLPLFMRFDNPFDQPLRITSIECGGQTVTLQWQSVKGQPYRVDSSSTLTTWSPLASNLVATGTNFSFTTNVSGTMRYFRVSRGP